MTFILKMLTHNGLHRFDKDPVGTVDVLGVTLDEETEFDFQRVYPKSIRFDSINPRRSPSLVRLEAPLSCSTINSCSVQPPNFLLGRRHNTLGTSPTDKRSPTYKKF